MKKPLILLLGLLLTGTLVPFAAAPVAMRVEVEPLRQAGDDTLVVVIIQVSPEDRARIGRNAIVRIELDGGRVSSGSPMRAVRFEDNGSTRIDIKWPPGEHDLRVEIEDASREDTGIWVGKVRIPDFSPDAEPLVESTSTPESEPEPDTPPVPEVAASTAVAASEPTPVIEPPTDAPETQIDETDAPDTTDEMPTEPATDTAPVFVAAAAAAATADEVLTPAPSDQEGREDPTNEVPSDPETAGDDRPVEIEHVAPVAVVAVPEERREEPPSIEETTSDAQPPEVAEEMFEAEDEVLITEDDAEPVVIDEPEEVELEPPVEEPQEVEEELPIVEPLRSDPAPESVTPEGARPVEPSAPAPAPAAIPLSAEMAARFADWERADSDTRDVSLIAMRGREPALDLDETALRLRVGGADVPIEKLGDPESAPLLLGLAVDVASEEVGGWSGARGSLGSLVRRAGGGRGRVFVATSQGVGPWGSQPDPPERGTAKPPGNNVAQLVIASLEPFAGQRGRTFLVVLTDGRNEPTKQEWSEASGAAAAAGVPILVIALWDDEFNHRTRKNLKQLTVESGGSLFLVQGSNQLDSAADRFGRLLDGSYAFRFKSPSGPQGKAVAISVTSPEKGLDVSAPKSIR